MGEKKLDLSSVIERIRAKKKDEKKAKKIALGDDMARDDFMEMPEWWQESTGTKGLPLGRMVMLAGDSDSGKTSAAIQSMLAAQKQGYGVIYVETEKKTKTEDLKDWGVDPSQVIVIKSTVAEEAFELLFEAWDGFKDAYPETNLLVIVDSIGNVVSQRDNEIDLTKDHQKPGGKGAVNRLAMSRMVAKMEEDHVAVLLINYTYDNIGSVGKTNAGGKSLNFFSALTYQTSRKGWYEGTEKGKKVRRGAIVRWKLYKNHINKTNPGNKIIDLKITKDGVEFMGGE